MIAIVHGDDTFNQAVGDDNHVRSRSNRWTQEVRGIRLGHRVGSLADDGTTIALGYSSDRSRELGNDQL